MQLSGQNEKKKSLQGNIHLSYHEFKKLMVFIKHTHTHTGTNGQRAMRATKDFVLVLIAFDSIQSSIVNIEKLFFFHS